MLQVFWKLIMSFGLCFKEINPNFSISIPNPFLANVDPRSLPFPVLPNIFRFSQIMHPKMLQVFKLQIVTFRGSGLSFIHSTSKYFITT